VQEFPLLRDLFVMFVVASIVVYALHLLRFPPMVGLLAAGLLTGPYGLGLISEIERVRLLAEVGVVVLLFTVGLEFSLSRFTTLWHSMLTVGVPQVLLCGLVVVAATWWHFDALGPAILAGMLVAMSSTAVVLKLLSERGELTSPHGRLSTAVLLLQDLLVLVSMLLLPFLVPHDSGHTSLWLGLAKGVGAMAGVLLATRFLIPRMFYHVVRTRNRELFLLQLVALCLGTALTTAAGGLSLALGAFLAGLALSDSEYAHQTLAEALPFRDTLSSVFFVSVGMLLNVEFALAHLPLVIVTVLGMICLKFVAVLLPLLISGYPLQTAVVTGMALAQIGEFSFVLANRGAQLGLMTADDVQTFLAAAVITMGLTPAMMAAAPRVASWLPDWTRGVDLSAEADRCALENHVILCGYGVSGRNVARTLRDVDVPYVVLEMNPVTVREQRAAGEPIYFGDCSRAIVLQHMGVHSANAMVLAISDPATTRRAVQAAHALNPDLYLIVRTRYLSDIEDLRRLGANEIIPEEFETSVEIFARVLTRYGVPRNLILDLIDRLRRDHYDVMRNLGHSPTKMELPSDALSELDVELCSLRPDSPAVGRSLAEIDLRAQTGATVIGVRRGREVLVNPGPDFQFHNEDIAILLGDRPQLDRALLVLDPSLMQKDRHPS
jgi:CPA2 family monovalent cation:H+ antiporter-2